MELNKIYNVDCMDGLRELPDKSVELVLTDVPYGECSGRKDGIRTINKGSADVVTFDIFQLVQELLRVCKGSFYVFCGIKQISPITEFLQGGGLLQGY